MTENMAAIRNSAKAVIQREGEILLTKNADSDGCFYLFPGGGQEKGEELKDAVVRECLEEIGQEVEPLDLLHVREYIGRNHAFKETDSHIHQVEFYFRCRLLEDGPEPVMNGSLPDADQIGVEWVPISKLTELRVYPEALARKLARSGELPFYIGDVF